MGIVLTILGLLALVVVVVARAMDERRYGGYMNALAALVMFAFAIHSVGLWRWVLLTLAVIDAVAAVRWFRARRAERDAARGGGADTPIG